MKKKMSERSVLAPTAEVIELPLDQLLEPEFAIRSHMNRGDLEELARSLREVGVIEPLIVAPKGRKFEVIAGHRRLVAARMAELVVVPCIVLPKSNEKKEVFRLHENLFREGLNPVDEARYFERLLEEKNISPGQLAEVIKRPESYIRARLEVLGWHPALITALEERYVSLGVARELAQIDDEEQLLFCLESAVKGGATEAVARQWKINFRLGQTPAVSSDDSAKKDTFGQEEKAYTVECAICGQPVETIKAKLVYAHRKCVEMLEADRLAE